MAMIRRQRQVFGPLLSPDQIRTFKLFGALAVLYVSLQLVLFSLRLDEPDPSLEMASPPWSDWRHRKMDNGMPRILLWHRDATPSHDDAKERRRPSSSSSSVTYCPLHSAGDHDERWISCEVTDNRSTLEWSDAVVFQAEQVSPEDMPTRRPGFQKWVLWTRKHVSPVGGSGTYPENLWGVHTSGHTHLKVPETEFDWTMGHRKDSDVETPYKALRCGDDVVAASSANKTTTVADVARRHRDVLGYYGARKDAVWIVGQCEWNMREKSSNVSVDFITDCGRSTCGSRRECVRKMAAHYHFVVVAADSDCFHSPYELIHDAFEFDIVPVLLAPRGETLNYPWLSVVHSVDFGSLGSMVAHLRVLLSSPEAYEKYFSWKERCVEVAADDLCQLCVAVNDKSYEGRVRRSPEDRSTDREIPASRDECRGRAPAFARAFPVVSNDDPN
ncbi:hypothetical protein MRX96_011223 [Rhipicephalus microplus]